MNYTQNFISLKKDLQKNHNNQQIFTFHNNKVTP